MLLAGQLITLILIFFKLAIDSTNCISGQSNNKIVKFIIIADVWIGLNDLQQEGDWKWISSLTSPNYTHWRGGEPNDFRDEDCAALSPSNWFDYSCNLTLHYVCEKDRQYVF